MDVLISYGLKNKHYYDFFEKHNNVGHVFKRDYLFRNTNILSENFQVAYNSDGYGSIMIGAKKCTEKKLSRFTEETTFLEKNSVKYIVKKGSKKKKGNLVRIKKNIKEKVKVLKKKQWTSYKKPVFISGDERISLLNNSLKNSFVKLINDDCSNEYFILNTATPEYDTHNSLQNLIRINNDFNGDFGNDDIFIYMLSPNDFIENDNRSNFLTLSIYGFNKNGIYYPPVFNNKFSNFLIFMRNNFFLSNLMIEDINKKFTYFLRSNNSIIEYLKKRDYVESPCEKEIKIIENILDKNPSFKKLYLGISPNYGISQQSLKESSYLEKCLEKAINKDSEIVILEFSNKLKEMLKNEPFVKSINNKNFYTKTDNIYLSKTLKLLLDEIHIK